MFLFVPWYLLEKPGMQVSQNQFNFWIFFSNALCALALNFSIFLVIGRTGAVTIRVAGVLKDWILIALSTVIFPESTITGLNIIGYAIGKSPLIWSASFRSQTQFPPLLNLIKILLYPCSAMRCCHVQLHKGQGCSSISTICWRSSWKNDKGQSHGLSLILISMNIICSFIKSLSSTILMTMHWNVHRIIMCLKHWSLMCLL